MIFNLEDYTAISSVCLRLRCRFVVHFDDAMVQQ